VPLKFIISCPQIAYYLIVYFWSDSMNKSRVVSIKNLHFFDSLLKNKIILLMCIMLIAGIFAGALLFSKSDATANLAEDLLKDFLKKRQGAAFLSITVSSALVFLGVALVTFIFGTSMMGIVLLPISLFFLGYFYGSFSALLYANHSIKGVAFNAVIVIPPLAIFLIGLIVTVKYAFDYSLILSKLTLQRGTPKNLCNDFKFYCGKYLILVFIILIASIVDAILNRSFLNYFSF